MSYRDSSSFGKRMEYEIIGKMLKDGYDVYLPMVDDHGVDCIVKKADGIFIEIQIKARSNLAKQPGCFTVDNHKEAISNFFFIFYSDYIHQTWVFSSSDFVTESHINNSGKYQGRRKLTLITPNGNISRKYKKYITDNLDFLK